MNIIEDHNRRMPLHWTAKGNVMSMEDHGACGFFHVLYVHLFYIGALSGRFSDAELEDMRTEADKLTNQKSVKLRLELQPTQLRIYSSDFGAFGKFNMLIPYSGLVQNYMALKSLPAGDDASTIEFACRGCEVLINAIERKAPGLVPVLLTSGLPKGFRFEDWPKDDGKIVPGQFLRIMPAGDLHEIVQWIQSAAFENAVSKLCADIDARWEGLEQRN